MGWSSIGVGGARVGGRELAWLSVGDVEPNPLWGEGLPPPRLGVGDATALVTFAYHLFHLRDGLRECRGDV